MGNCIDCPSHEVINDADPEDWLCDDDKAVICKLIPSEEVKPNSKWLSDRSMFRKVTCSCRPFNLRKESETPDWCPKKKEKN